MRHAPSQQDLKRLLDDAVKHGSRARIANILGVTEGNISRRFNPNDELKLALADGLRECWAVCGADESAGQILRSYINGLFDSWLAPAKSGQAAITSLVCDVNRETADLVNARMESRPLHLQLKEAREVGAANDRVIQALERQIQEQNDIRMIG